MNVSLPTDLKQWIDREVASGRFASVDQAIADGVRLLAERDAWRDDVRAKIAEGIAQADAGQLVDGEQAFRGAHERLMKRHGAGAGGDE